MLEWVLDSLTGKPLGFLFELGPFDHVDDEQDGEIICAQIQVLDDDVLLLRRSKDVLGHLMLADYSAAGAVLDQWYFDTHFDDCTDGYLFSRDLDLIAEACVAWFRDNWGETRSVDEIGCSCRFPDTLLPTPDPTD
ncbi:hypothetical protein Q8814_17990 [Rhodococcus sp. CC-R104]|uniref:Uncharacterized protein n=2 Tax=Rhodococcus chondri TaxID=3065941 RepID=A0ABU7JVD6_9NOCA|nr:hypothetical protein [Rhodococcus sp. CC-R104]